MKHPSRVLLESCGRPPRWRIEPFQRMPEPGPGEVVLRMARAPVNPADLNILEGTYGDAPDPPFTPGNEGAGIVESVATDVRNLRRGDWVLPMTRGTWTSWMRVPAGRVIAIPPETNPDQAAMLAVNPPTARLLLEEFVHLTPGEWVVQNASNSGVGRCVIQIARSLGIRTLNFVRRAELIPELESLGADRCVVDDGNQRETAAVLRRELGARLGFNAVGGQSALNVANCLADCGTLVTYGAMSKQPLKLPNGMLIFRNLCFTGFWLSRWLRDAPPEKTLHLMTEIAAMAAEGTLIQPVDRTFSLDQLEAALNRAREPHRSGKVLLDLQPRV